jgi:dTDP-4-amino-4,6-dideoxygalactose transaminase
VHRLTKRVKRTDLQIPQIDLRAQHEELGAQIDAAVARVLGASAFIGGEEVAAFEREFAAHLGVRHVVGVANGTDALEIALQALGIGPGDTVLTVPFTFIATVEAIVRAGAAPAFADIGDDFTLDVESAAAVLERQPVKAVIPVHLYGHPADMHRLLELARRHRALVIEDAAQAHGAWCTVGGKRRRAGSVGDAACFSFYPSKNLGALGDAGAIATNDDALAERLRLIANHGERSKYEHVLANGRNSRLDGLQAAALRVKLARLDDWNQRRRAIAVSYAERLHGLPLRPPAERPGVESAYHQYAVRLANRDAVRSALGERGIGTAVHYPRALHQLEPLRHLGKAGAFPSSEAAAAEVLSLPMHPHLDEHSIARVAASLSEILG